jgi:hypothetical protein
LRLFKIFHYKRKSKERLLQLFQRVLAVTGEPGRGCRGVLFLFSDNAGGKVSAVARVIKAHPEMAAFRYEGPVWPNSKDLPRYAALGNFGPPFMEHNPNQPTGTPPIATLVDILEGIPRRFPFRQAFITIDGVDWDDAGHLLSERAAPDKHPPAAGHGRYLFPCVMLNDDAHVFMQAVVELSPSNPRVSAVAKAKLDRIGAIGAETTRALYDGGEEGARFLEQHQRATAFVDRFKADLGSWLRSRVALPADLPPTNASGSDKPFSLKDILTKAFAPLGYQKVPRMSDQSVTVLDKRLPSNHRLELFVDRGTTSRALTCTFAFYGVEKTHSFDLPVHPDQRGSYPADGQEVVNAVVGNWAAIVRALENDFVPELIRIYGADPDWG